MRYKGFDLNLLVALDALVEHRSVSRAAEQLNMSQPAMSAALGRLRSYFDDPILGAHGKRMIPTAHALILQPMLREVLGSVEALLSVSSAFNPATAQRQFRIGASDYIAAVIFNQLVSELERAAPGIALELIPPFEGQVAMLDQGNLDILLTPEEHTSPDHPTEHLMDESYVVMGCGRNPVFDRGPTEDDFFAAGHIVIEIGRHRSSFAETHLRQYGSRRRVDLIVSSFLLVGELLINTARLVVVQERLAIAFSRRMDVRFAPMPFAFPTMKEMVQYNRTRSADSGLRWMIDQIKNATNNLRN